MAFDYDERSYLKHLTLKRFQTISRVCVLIVISWWNMRRKILFHVLYMYA